MPACASARNVPVKQVVFAMCLVGHVLVMKRRMLNLQNNL